MKQPSRFQTYPSQKHGGKANFFFNNLRPHDLGTSFHPARAGTTAHCSRPSLSHGASSRRSNHFLQTPPPCPAQAQPWRTTEKVVRAQSRPVHSPSVLLFRPTKMLFSLVTHTAPHPVECEAGMKHKSVSTIQLPDDISSF